MARSPIPSVLKSIAANSIGQYQHPSFVTFFVTWACNHRCVFCDVWKKTPEDEMSVVEIEKIFKQLKKLDVLRITGGEPYTRSDLSEIINIIDAVNDPTMIHITTNGINTRRIIKSLETLNNVSKVHIKVSIDDIGEKHDDIRGVSGAYEKAIETVRELVKFRDNYGLHVGVNQAILNESSMQSYETLKSELKKYDVPVYASIAYDSSSTLYSESDEKNNFRPDSSVKPFGDWSENALEEAMSRLASDNRETGDFKERLVDNYFVNGLYDRMVKKVEKNGPRCVALNNHLRLLPNGDIPICLYNGTVVGNVREKKFKDIWFSNEIKPHRNFVRNCSGCWSSCETAVSAIYTGDIWKGLFKRKLMSEIPKR